MRSSTFSSSVTRRSGVRASLAWFGATLLALIVTGEILSQRVAVLAYTRVPRPALPAGSWYLDSRPWEQAYSHFVLYFGLGRSIDSVRRADILLLGNSRMLFAFPSDVLAPRLAKYGLSAFNLGFQHSEFNAFPERVLERNDLRPRVVIVNEDQFFTGTMSPLARSIVGRTAWDDRKAALEARAAHDWRSTLGALLPRFLPQIPVPYESTPNMLWFTFRSEDTGGIYVEHWPDYRLPVRADRGVATITDVELRAGERFRDWLRQRGGRLVLTYIPSSIPFGTRERAREFAERLRVPFVSPQLDDLRTSDRSHLDPASARRFTDAFVEALLAVPGLREFLTEPHQNVGGDPRFPAPTSS